MRMQEAPHFGGGDALRMPKLNMAAPVARDTDIAQELATTRLHCTPTTLLPLRGAQRNAQLAFAAAYSHRCTASTKRVSTDEPLGASFHAGLVGACFPRTGHIVAATTRPA
jgi:hypothetical protein